jgi:hypothetical protein
MKTRLSFVAIFVAIILCILIPSIQYAQDGTELSAKVVSNHPAINVEITDGYRTADFPESPDNTLFSGRKITTFDMQGNIVSSESISETGRVKTKKIMDYNDSGDRSVNIFMVNRGGQSGLKTNTLRLSQFDSSNRLVCEKSCDFTPGQVEIEESTLYYDYTVTGNELVTAKKEDSGRTWERLDEVFYENGKLKKQTKYNYFGSDDEANCERETRDYNESGYETKYTQVDKKGEVVIEIEKQYDVSGRLLKSTKKNNYGDKSKSIDTYKYTDNTKVCFTSINGEEPFESQYIEKNEYGEIVLNWRTQDGDSSKSSTSYTYEDRDEYGNWRKKTTTETMVDKDGNETLLRKYVYYRTIIYYPELPDTSVADVNEECGADAAE